MPAVTAGRVCLTVAALTTSISPYIADWNETHVKNPNWPPHARFHNGQTMSTGLALGLLTLYFTWRRSPINAVDSLRTAAILGSFYGATAMTAIMYPGALAIDPEFGEGFPQLPCSRPSSSFLPLVTMAEHHLTSNVSQDLVWEMCRGHNAFLVKRKTAGGQQFSKDPLNLMNKHSRKGYRADLRQEAVARASALKESQRSKKEDPKPKLRGSKAKKAESTA
ncbi:MAG: hypothetical protein OHK93_003010 [Ramalina farinacea]|uniref:Ribosomal eL28/Mak16 domain-containing protein n=1 Tax=Ramalina farinacea TaxID=258253 RepID=A0AA43QUA0_9LECA|nr:hypothetical protein [Ramalina farinacea]